ncbi:hypothetical protein KEJ47_10080, partial [Candidatus Bathyarchaeota archaeon]|nr:hypothetical protein [Candidatus Bathyarchaeota archaeon]
KDTVYDVRKTIDAQAGRFINQTYGIVSAGGQGVRLRPRTIELPKPLIEVGLQKQPLMYWSMLPMILGGVSHFIVGVRYGAEKIRSKFGEGGGLSNRFGREITIDYVEEPEPLGRAGFIRYGIQQGVIPIDNPAILFNASDILKVNLRDLVRHFIWLNICHGFEVVQVYTSGFRVQYGIGKVDLSTLRVIDFEEKPLRQDLASTATYIIHGRLKDFLELKKMPSNPEDELVQRWIKEETLGAYIMPHQDLISIKYEKDLDTVEEIDLESHIRSKYI